MRNINPGLKAALEYGPLVVFFLAFLLLKERTISLGGNDYGGVVGATLVFVPVLVLCTAAQWALTGTLSVMQMLTLVLVVVFGGLSIWLNDPRFFKMKPTIIYLLLAGLLGLGLALRRNWLGVAMGEMVPLAPEGWRKLTQRLVVLFLALAVLNEIVWRTQSDTTWVLFKTVGLIVLTIGFFAANMPLIRRYALPEDDSR